MSLENLLRAAMREARSTSTEVRRDLERGLQVRVRADPDRVLLLRSGAAPGEAEAYIVGQALGWSEPLLSTFAVPGRAPGFLVTPSDPDEDGIDLDDEPVEEVVVVQGAARRPALPVHLMPIYAAAQDNRFPRGPQTIKSGLVMNLNEYVMAWAEAWPSDVVQIEWRLMECEYLIQNKQAI